ncbi:hypothetical protein J6590_067163 [Homalodisca vitripennis]|nr:hypothetical protein J6590_067163 [Homalodisca vitripennis]
MESVHQNTLPQAGTLTSEGNPVTNSDRVKAPVVGAGSTDFGGSQMYDVANQAGVTGVDHLAPCMPTITSEAEGMKLSVTSEEALLRTLTDKINRLAEFILEKKNVHNELKAMARGTIRAMKDFVKVRHTIAKKSIACIDRTCQTSPFFLQKNKPPEREPRDRQTPPSGPAKKRCVWYNAGFDFWDIHVVFVLSNSPLLFPATHMESIYFPDTHIELICFPATHIESFSFPTTHIESIYFPATHIELILFPATPTELICFPATHIESFSFPTTHRVDLVPRYSYRVDLPHRYSYRVVLLPHYSYRVDLVPRYSYRVDLLPRYSYRVDLLPCYSYRVDLPRYSFGSIFCPATHIELIFFPVTYIESIFQLIPV